MDTNPGLPFVVALDDSDDPADVIDALALGRFSAGIEPAACTLRLSRVRKDAPLLPPGAQASWIAQDNGRRSHLARGEGWSLRAVRWNDRTANVTVTATCEELARDILAQATADAVEAAAPEDEAVRVGFWHGSDRCPARRVEREVAIKSWPSIAENYSRNAAASFETVMSLDPACMTARLLLVHGPPGTGKTTAIRALAHAWRKWCRLEVVLDPERLLSDSDYLLSVVAEDDEDDENGRRWRLVVLEDCDELIRAEAKSGAGQALARLLNLTDGLLGQGLEVLVVITTNEPMQKLHPAVSRPGRCLAEIAVGPLPRAEAIRWLGRHDGVGADGATLAELFVLRGELSKVESRPLTAVVGGQYL